MQATQTRHFEHRACRGFTLIELLIAVVIFSIGLLGVVTLQVTSLRSNQMSSMRAQATQATYNMADRIRANTVAALAGEYDGVPSTATTDCEGTSNNCTPAQMAAYDKNAWLVDIGLLPSGAGSITNNGSGAFTITVRWDEERRGATGTNCPPVSANDLRCYQLDIVL